MLEQLKYVNHKNEVFDFGKNGVFVNENDLHDFEWSVSKKNNRIAAFSKDVVKRKLPITIICASESEAIAAKNRLLEVTEKDVYAMQPGKIFIGDYYFKCYVTQSQKSSYLINKRYMKATLTLTSDLPVWVKETTKNFVNSQGARAGASGMDYPYDFPFDFLSGTNNGQIINTGFVDANFKLIIYGACSNPAVYIGDHVYQVNCDVGDNEYLTIDADAKKIYLTRNNGEIVNVFAQRNRESYIFQKIPAGGSPVSWNGDFGFDVVLFEERSEPKWT